MNVGVYGVQSQNNPPDGLLDDGEELLGLDELGLELPDELDPELGLELLD